MKNALDNYTELLLFRVKTDEDLSFARLEELLESWYLLRRSIKPEEEPEEGERIATAACAQTSLERRTLPARRDARNDNAAGETDPSGPAGYLPLQGRLTQGEGNGDARAVEGAGPYEGEAAGSTLGEDLGEAFREGFQNFEPVAPPQFESKGFYGPQAVMKRKTLERVEQLRAAGRRAADFLTASGGALSASELAAMLRREKVPFRAWEALAKACEQLEGKTE